MKKRLSLLLCAALIFSLFAIVPCSAQTTDNPSATVPAQLPQIRITTENGSGTTLQKSDGYVNAAIDITDNGDPVINSAVRFKVRGNTTAMLSVKKKAYTFKFSKKQDLFGMGKSKKWVLIANAFDPTLLRNYIAFELARHLGLAYTSEQRFVELWVDDSFRGLYTLMEPVKQGKDHVDIDIESNNGMTDFLIEFERLLNEDDVTYFTTNNLRFAVKEPEAPNEAQLAYIREITDDIVTTIRNGSREDIETKIDVPSFVKYYLLNEFCKTYDFDTSSIFYYYQNGKLHAGPAWDYDLSTGNTNPTGARGIAAHDPDGVFAQKQLFGYLCKHDWFMEAVREEYRDNYAYLENISAPGGQIDDLLSAYGAAIDRNFTQTEWGPSKAWINIQNKPSATYAENLNYLRNWLSDRHIWLRDHYGVYLVGDTDGDYQLTVLDATLIQRILVALTEDPDGRMSRRARSEEELTILDATAVQRKLTDYPVKEPIGEPALY